MNYLALIPVLIAAAWAVDDCGRTPVQPDIPSLQRIVGGHDAKPYSWPWQITLYRDNRLYCGGSIIDQNWVMSAGHCVYRATNQPNRYKIKVGLYHHLSNNEPGEQVHEVEAIHLHPNFTEHLGSPFLVNHDVSLFKLKTPIQFSDHIQPVCLPRHARDVAEVVQGRNCVVTGWGRIRYGGAISQVLKQVQLQFPSQQQCKDDFAPGGVVQFENMICAGIPHSHKGSCNGDSGGPLVIKDNSTGRWFQYGVVSWGQACDRLSSVFGRASSFCLFIKQTLGTDICF